jgi:hypothetical protein
MLLLLLLPLLLLLFPLLLAVRCIVSIRNHKMQQIGCCCCSSSSLLLLLLLLLLFSLLLLAVRCIVSFRNHKMRRLGITPLGRILIIETKAEQLRTNDTLTLSSLPGWRRTNTGRIQVKTGGELKIFTGENEHLSQIIGGDPFIVKT